MNIAGTIARYLMGLLFTVFGANGFLHFIHQPPPSSPLVAQYMTVMFGSHYIMPVFAIQVIGGLLLLAGIYVPLALALLAPVIVNILLFHLTMDMSGIAPGIVVTICWAILFTRYRANFAGVFQAK